MPRGQSSNVSAQELYNALRGLTGEELDRLKESHGSLKGILAVVEKKFRDLDNKGTFKKSALEEAFATFDKKHGKAFSKAARLSSSEDWAEEAPRATCAGRCIA